MEAIKGTLQKITFQNDSGWAVFSISSNTKEGTPCTGVLPLGVRTGIDALELTGEWQMSRYGRQFKAKAVTLSKEITPLSGEGIVIFLSKLPGIGQARAQALMSKFGDDLWNVLDKEPHLLTEVSGITEKMIGLIKESYHEMQQDRIMLVTMFGWGLTSNQVNKIVGHFKDEDPLELVRQEPYRMLDIDGFGFITVDTIALKSGTMTDDPCRIDAGLEYVMCECSASEGHIWVPIPYLVKMSMDMFVKTATDMKKTNKVSLEHINASIERLCQKGLLRRVKGGVASKALYQAEQTILGFLEVA